MKIQITNDMFDNTYEMTEEEYKQFRKIWQDTSQPRSQIKKILIQLRGSKCELCKQLKRVEIHHKTYKEWQKYSLEKLMLVCSKCHNAIHNKLGPKKMQKGKSWKTQYQTGQYYK